MSIESTALDLVRVEIKELKNYGINLAFAYENLKKQHNALIDCIHSMVSTNDSIYTLMNEINAILVTNGNKCIAPKDNITEVIALETHPKKIESIKKENKKEIGEELLSLEVIVLDFSTRTITCFKSNGIITIRDLINCSEKELLKIPYFGRLSLREVKEVLDAKGLKLKED